MHSSMHSPQAPRPAVRLKTSVFERITGEAGLDTDTAIAAQLGMNQASIWRVLHRKTTPSASFIAGVLASFPGVQFEDVFEVVVPGNFRAITKCKCAA